MTGAARLAVILAAVAGDFWLGWTLCVSYHRHAAKRRRQRRPPPDPDPTPTAMQASRPAGTVSTASTYLDGGTRKRTRVVRHDRR